ncbi:MAG: VWA domain-containing protein [Terriglobia bacterium]
MLLTACAALVPCWLRAQKRSGKEVATRQVEPTFKLQAERNLVMVRVVVRDAKGAAVDNLRKEDFELFDRGKPQTILEFSIEKAAPRPGEKEVEKKPPAELESPAETRTAPSPAPYLLALYVDDVHTSFESLVHSRDAADHYLATSLGPEDRVGLFTTSGQNQLDFTADFAKVHQALLRLHPHPLVEKDESCATIPPYEAYLITEEHDNNALKISTDEVLYCQFGGDPRFLREAQSLAQTNASQVNMGAEAASRATVQGLESLVRRMSVLPGRRAVVIVSSGFLTEVLRYELGEIIDHALRANIVLNALDARGLYTPAAVADASQANIANTKDGALAGRKAQILNDSAKLETSGMQALAQDTGGIFFQNSNDLEDGLRRAAALPDAYYLLTFSPASLKHDGAFHALKVKLVTQPGLTLQAREGYYAPRKAEDPAAREKEELQEAVFSQDEGQDQPLKVDTQYLMKNPSEAQLTVAAHLDLHAFRFRRQDGDNLADLTFVTALFDHDGNLVTAQQNILPLRFRDADLTKHLENGITTRTHLDVKAGNYRVRTVVRDSEGGQIYALNHNVEIAYHADFGAFHPNNTIVNWPLKRALREIPELKGLEPSSDQSRLPEILRRVGETLQTFLKDFASTTSLETIQETRKDKFLGTREGIEQQFHYLMLAQQEANAEDLVEYRTNLHGREEPSDSLIEDYLKTTGFASMPFFFGPHEQPLSDFRYLGQQTIDGLRTEVVAFAEHVEPEAVRGHFIADKTSVPLLLQGVAWIDAGSYQILQMRTDLLAPQPRAELNRMTTVVSFAAVKFQDRPSVFWLPQEVNVTVEQGNFIYANRHRYSDYQLFKVETQENVQAPKPTAPPER